MPTYNPGTIVLMNFPFTDLQTSKVRPALVLTSKGDDVIILGIFSKVPDELGDSWIKIDKTDQGFHLTGLKKTSVVKTEKIAVIQKSLIRKQLGSLPLALMQEIKAVLLKTLEIG